jgi:hypothetical protein
VRWQTFVGMATYTEDKDMVGKRGDTRLYKYIMNVVERSFNFRLRPHVWQPFAPLIYFWRADCRFVTICLLKCRMGNMIFFSRIWEGPEEDNQTRIRIIGDCKGVSNQRIEWTATDIVSAMWVDAQWGKSHRRRVK